MVTIPLIRMVLIIVVPVHTYIATEFDLLPSIIATQCAKSHNLITENLVYLGIIRLSQVYMSRYEWLVFDI